MCSFQDYTSSCACLTDEGPGKSAAAPCSFSQCASQRDKSNPLLISIRLKM